MITVIYSPKGGTGKTSITKQLSYFIKGDVSFLDLDFNEGLCKVLELNQPKPKEIDSDFVNQALEPFFDDGHLIVDCSGYPTNEVINALARADNIIIPITAAETDQHTINKTCEVLSEISKKINFELVGHILWNQLNWNSSIEKLNEKIPEHKNIKPLAFGIYSDTNMKRGLKIKSVRAVKSIRKLIKVIHER